jgi:hypothetical protein
MRICAKENNLTINSFGLIQYHRDSKNYSVEMVLHCTIDQQIKIMKIVLANFYFIFFFAFGFYVFPKQQIQLLKAK